MRQSSRAEGGNAGLADADPLMVALAHRGEKQGEHNTMVYRGVSMPMGGRTAARTYTPTFASARILFVDVNV